MAILSKSELLKRDNVSVLVEKVLSGGTFKLGSDGKSGEGSCTNKIKVVFEKVEKILVATEKTKRSITNSVFSVCNSKQSSDFIEIEIQVKSSKRFYKLSDLYKDKEFGGVAGKSTGAGSERQEIGLITSINDSCSKSKTKIQNVKEGYVLSAKKNTGLSQLKQEKYIDVILNMKNGSEVGVSCKGSSAHSLAGGGLVGIDNIDPTLLTKVFASIQNYLQKELKLKQGDMIDANFIPDIGIEISRDLVRKIIVGTEAMGGPIDYMYIGPMDVSISSFSGETLRLNGQFYSVDEYIQKLGGRLFFRIRKRDLPSNGIVKVEYTRKNKSGYPLLLCNPTSGAAILRIVVEDKPKSTWKILSV